MALAMLMLFMLRCAALRYAVLCYIKKKENNWGILSTAVDLMCCGNQSDHNYAFAMLVG